MVTDNMKVITENNKNCNLISTIMTPIKSDTLPSFTVTRTLPYLSERQMAWSPFYNSELHNGKQQWLIILNKSSVKYFELKFFADCWCNKGLRNLMFYYIDLHIFLYILNAKKYCSYRLHALCVQGARTLHGLEILKYMALNDFFQWFLHSSSHMFTFQQAFCYTEVIKFRWLPFLPAIYIVPLLSGQFSKFPGWPLNRGPTVVRLIK